MSKPKLPDRPELPLVRLRPSDIITLKAGTLLHRIYFGNTGFGSWGGFRRWGPLDSRFDYHPDGPAKLQEEKYAVLYAATDTVTPVVEMFQDGNCIDLFTRKPYWVTFELVEDIHLLDLRSGWLTRNFGGPKIYSCAKTVSKAWARDIWDAYCKIPSHPKAVVGVSFMSSRHAPGHAVALFSGAMKAMPGAPKINAPLHDDEISTTLLDVIHRTGWSLTEDSIMRLRAIKAASMKSSMA